MILSVAAPDVAQSRGRAQASDSPWTESVGERNSNQAPRTQLCFPWVCGVAYFSR